MDDPALDRAEHERALRGLTRINAISRTAATLWPTLEPLLDRAAAPAQVLDVAAGSGDVLATLARRARRRGREVRFTACDISPVALDAVRRRDGNIRIIQRDVIEQGLPDDYDVIMCSLFIHHLTEPQIIALLASMRDAARVGVVISDLRRSRGGQRLAYAASRLLTRSRVVHNDAVLSARAALTIEEIADLAGRAGLDGAIATPRFPSRWLLRWERS
jgi:SAM-dependent methyltransferase